MPHTRMRHAAVAVLRIIILFYEDIRRNFIPTFLSVLHTCASNKSRLLSELKTVIPLGTIAKGKKLFHPQKNFCKKCMNRFVCLSEIALQPFLGPFFGAVIRYR